MEAAMRQQAVASTSGSSSSRAWRACPAARSRGRGHVAPRASLNFDFWQSGSLPEQYKPPSVVPGTRTLATPRLDAERVYQRLLESSTAHSRQHYGALYSSALGGITIEPGLMVVHCDDHMVSRGHGVYDVIPLVGGALYQMEEHVARLLRAASDVGLAPPMSEPALKRVLLDTAAASLKLNGHVIVWVTGGRAGMGVSNAPALEQGLYALVTTEWAIAIDFVDRTKGWRATVSPVQPPPDYFARLKTPGSIEAAVAQLEAEGRGFDVPFLVDEEGHVLGSPAASLAIITQDHRFVYAPFERAPVGITVETLASLIQENLDVEDLPIEGVEQRPISQDDVCGALEAMLVSSSHGVVGVTALDEHQIADGQPGYITLALQAVLTNDREPREGSPRHTPVPYGGITGMRSQLT